MPHRRPRPVARRRLAHRRRAGGRCVPALQDVLAKRPRQRLGAIGEREVVSGAAAIEGLTEGLHAFGHREVAHAHFPEIRVHIGAEMVEKSLRGLRPALDLAQPAQNHPQMRQKQVKTAINRVRHAQARVQALIKQGFSRLRHDHAIDGFNGAARS